VILAPGAAIPESGIVIVSPHFDDVPCMLGGWLLAMGASGELASRRFWIIVVFSRSNYTARAGEANYDARAERIRDVSGTRLSEDCSCLDELLGAHNYRYELGLEDECLVRGNRLTDSAFEFPHGTYEDFDAADWAILERLEGRIGELLEMRDTAIVVPAAYREHKDHFLVREAARRARALAAREGRLFASVYYQEDKPYAGLADDAERERVLAFAREEGLDGIAYAVDAAAVADLVRARYPSQYEPIYRDGIVGAAKRVASDYGSASPLDRILAYTRPASG
jgi:LmbE family N-acetylglucosaminyl deacetylase